MPIMARSRYGKCDGTRNGCLHMVLLSELEADRCEANMVLGHSRGRAFVEGAPEHRGQGASVHMSHIDVESAPSDAVIGQF